jgi:hypothetical protein
VRYAVKCPACAEPIGIELFKKKGSSRKVYGNIPSECPSCKTALPEGSFDRPKRPWSHRKDRNASVVFSARKMTDKKEKE